MLDLAGVWTLSDESGAHSVAFAVPGDAITALHKAGVIPDPYWGHNEYDCRWVCERDWVATRVFTHDGGAADLVVEGLDTVAELRLNGEIVLSAANAHRRWHVPVVLRRGDNEIAITFWSSVRVAAALQATMPFPIPYQQVNGPIPNANMLRKPQCDFGWDWNIALGQFGTWGAVRLEPQGARIGDVIISQRHAPGRAEVRLRVKADGDAMTAELCGISRTVTVVGGADPADWNIASPVMESHQKNPCGNARIAQTMFRTFRFPVDFENFVYLSQVQQGLAIKTAVTHWRSLKPHCMGTLYWQLNDTWPACSWSSLDHGGNWKLLHHMAREFYSPLLVTAVPGQDGIALKAVNDTAALVTLEVDAYAVAMSGAIRPLGTWTPTVPDNRAVDVAHLSTDTLGPDEILSFTWRRPDQPHQADIFAPKPWKAYDLPVATLTHSIEPARDGWQIIIDTDRPAFFVAIEADQPGRFDKNAFALYPGYAATVIFTPQTQGPAPRLTLRDLYSATYGPPPGPKG